MQGSKLNKKGVLTLGQVAPVVIILMTIGIDLTVGLLIMAEVKDQATTTNTQTITNETQTGLADGTAIVFDLANADQLDRSSTVVIVTNASIGGQNTTVVPATNYTLNSGAASLEPTTGSAAAYGDGWNVSYTLSTTTRTIAINGSQNSEEGLDTLATFQSIFGIIVAAAIVLGVIVLFR